MKMLSSRSKKVTTYGRRNSRIAPARDKPSVRELSLNGDKHVVSSDFDSESGRDVELTGTMSSVYLTQSRKIYNARRQSKGTASDNVHITSRPKPLRQPLAERTTNIPSTPSRPNGKGKSKASLYSPTTRIATVDIITLNATGKQIDEEKRVIKKFEGGGKTRAANTTYRITEEASGSPRGSSALARNNKVETLSDTDTSSDDDYVPRRLNRQSKSNRITKSATQGSSTSRRVTRTSEYQEGKCPSAVVSHKNPSSSRKPVLAKGSVRTIILSDSDDDSEDCTTKHGQIRAGQRKLSASTGNASDVQSQTSAMNSRSSIKEPLRSRKHFDELGNQSTKATSTIARQVHSSNLASTEHIYTGQRSIVPTLTAIATKHTPSQCFKDDYDDSISIDEELMLALELAEVELQDDNGSESIARGGLGKPLSKNNGKETHPQPKRTSPNLRPLLSECGQIVPFEFASFIETFPVDPIVSFCDTNIPLGKSHSSYEKVGEASYSEVFGIGNVVLKIIPLLVDGLDTSLLWTASNDPPPSSGVEDVLNEIRITRTMGEICKGFIRLLRAHIVQGPYPKSLLTLWDEYDSKRGSESIRPGDSS